MPGHPDSGGSTFHIWKYFSDPPICWQSRLPVWGTSQSRKGLCMAALSCKESRPASWSVLPSKTYGIRGTAVRKTCPVGFMISANGVITVQPLGCWSKGLSPVVVKWCPLKRFPVCHWLLGKMSNDRTSKDHIARTSYCELGSVKPMKPNKVRQAQQQFLVRRISSQQAGPETTSKNYKQMA